MRYTTHRDNPDLGPHYLEETRKFANSVRFFGLEILQVRNIDVGKETEVGREEGVTEAAMNTRWMNRCLLCFVLSCLVLSRLISPHISLPSR